MTSTPTRMPIRSLPRCGSLMLAAAVLPLISPAGAASRDHAPAVRLAQAGSTGDAIGKQGKSASGGEGAALRRAARTPHRAPTTRAAPAPRAVSGCARLPGQWSWFTRDVVTIQPGGNPTAGRLTGQWTCIGSRVTSVWSHGFTDRLTLSGGSSHLAATNGFTRVWGNRL